MLVKRDALSNFSELWIDRSPFSISYSLISRDLAKEDKEIDNLLLKYTRSFLNEQRIRVYSNRYA